MSRNNMKEYWQGRFETRELASKTDCGHRTTAEKLAFIGEEYGTLNDEQVIRIFEEENGLLL